ncbi:MAG: glucose-6-phosphate dehydrogenase assembly protein OpcA [Acidimicrobiales bacterium]
MNASATSPTVWAAENTDVASVLEALDTARRQAVGATTAAVMTLVVVGHNQAAIKRAIDGLHQLGGRHPARAIALQIDDGAEPRLSASVATHRAADGSGTHTDDAEDIYLEVAGPVTRHLDSLVEPFTLPDLPVVAWFVDRLPAVGDPILNVADTVLVDARDFGGPDCFSAVAALLDLGPVVDLSWQRLQPWRSLLRSTFDTPRLLPFVGGVHAVAVEGKAGPRNLIGGWLIDRLDLPLSAVRLTEAQHVRIQVSAATGGEELAIGVGRDANDRMLRATAVIDGGPSFANRTPLPPAGPAWGLAEGLSNFDTDRVYARALRTALDF